MRQKKALYQKHLEESGGVYFSFCVYQNLVAVTSDRVTVGLCLSFPSCNVTAALGRSVNRDTTHLGITTNRGASSDCARVCWNDIFCAVWCYRLWLC